MFSTATRRVRAMCIDVRSRISARTSSPENRPGDRADRPRDEPAVDRRAALLREQDVRVLLGEQLVARLGEDPARDLVGHARSRQVHRLVLPEQLGGAALELEDGRVLALLLVADVGVRHRRAHRRRRPRRGIGAKIDHAQNLAITTSRNRVVTLRA